MASFRILSRLPILTPTIWATIQTVFMQGFGFLLFAIQAPVIGPRAFGLLSIVMVFVGFAESVLSDTAYETLLSMREITAEHYETMNTVCAVASMLFGVAIFAGASRIATWFGEPELIPVLHLMAFIPLFTSMAAAPIAVSKREMQFRPLAIRTIVSLLFGGATGIILTFLDFGVWALVWQSLVQKLLAVIILWYTVPIGFRLGYSRRHLADFWQVAPQLLLSRTMNWGSGQIPRFVLGLYVGATDLGIFSLASRLSDIVVQVILVPRYAVARMELRRHEADRSRLDAALRQVVFNYSFISFPLCVGGAVLMPTVFHLWLDARWSAGVVPAQLLLLTCIPMVSSYTVGALLLAFNRQTAEAMVATAQTIASLLAVVVAAPFGLNAAVAAIAARPLLILPLPLLAAKTKCNISINAILAPQIPLLVCAVIMGVAVAASRFFLVGLRSDAILLVALTMIGAATYALAVAVMLPRVARETVQRLANLF